jgi:hypothetical protein
MNDLTEETIHTSCLLTSPLFWDALALLGLVWGGLYWLARGGLFATP